MVSTLADSNEIHGTTTNAATVEVEGNQSRQASVSALNSVVE